MELRNVRDLFANFAFVTPDYQRGYAWGSAQTLDFWEDVTRIGVANPQHFAGTLIVEVVPNGAEKVDATLVDGQQRLTTVVLMAAAIAKHLETQGQAALAKRVRTEFLGTIKSPAFRYGPTHEAWPALALQMFDDPAAVAKASGHHSAYTKNLERALVFFGDRISSLAADDLAALVLNLQTKLVFSLVEVDPRHFNIHVAFESINHRGKQLTKLELLKNRLIYLATVLHRPPKIQETAWETKKESLRREINEAWGDVYSWLGRETDEPLDEEEFLRTHAVMYFDVDTGEKDWLESLLFRSRFTAARALDGSIKPKEILDYLNSLRLSAVLWSHVQHPRRMPPDQELWLNRILHVSRPLFDPIILAAYVRLVQGDLSLAADLRKTASRDTELINLLQEIERFIVLVFLVTGKRSHTGRKDFARIAHLLHSAQGRYDGKASVALDYLARLIRASVTNVDPDDAEERLDDEFQTTGYLDLAAFENEIAKALRHGNGYYGHDLTRVLLFEYEESLRLSDKGAVKVPWDRVSADSIEHIYPQSDEHWRELTKALGGGVKKARVNSYRHSLGNLLLLNQRKNASLQHFPYAGRNRQIAKRFRFAQGSYSETSVAAGHTVWSGAAIVKRGRALLSFADRRWDFSFSQAGVKYKSLLVID